METTSNFMSEKGICQVERRYGEGESVAWRGDVCAPGVSDKHSILI